MRLSVALLSYTGEHIRYIPLREANRMVAEDLADRIDPKQPSKGVRLAPRMPRISEQHRVLHEVAILRRKSFVTGGLTRTETKPFDSFKNK